MAQVQEREHRTAKVLTLLRGPQLRIAVLVERRKHDEWAIRFHALPFVIPYYNMVNGEGNNYPRTSVPPKFQ